MPTGVCSCSTTPRSSKRDESPAATSARFLAQRVDLLLHRLQIRVALEGLAVRGERLLGLPERFVAGRQVDVGDGVVGGLRDGLAVGGEGLPVAPLAGGTRGRDSCRPAGFVGLSAMARRYAGFRLGVGAERGVGQAEEQVGGVVVGPQARSPGCRAPTAASASSFRGSAGRAGSSSRALVGVDRHRLVRAEGQRDRLARSEGGLDGELLVVVARLARCPGPGRGPGHRPAAPRRRAPPPRTARARVKKPSRPLRGQGDDLLEALDGAIGAPVTGVQLAQPRLRLGDRPGAPRPAAGARRGRCSASTRRREVGLQAPRLPVGGDRGVEPLLGRVAHAQVDVGGGVARIDAPAPAGTRRIASS